MNKELEALKALENIEKEIEDAEGFDENTYYQMDRTRFKIIKTALKDYENLKEENKLLRENNENLDENYYDTWCACEALKENSNYALMFIDDIYCLVDTKDNKFDVIDNYKINNNSIIDNSCNKKLKALEIIKAKRVNVEWLLETENVEEYNESLYVNLTQEEYELLKKVLL